jgi:hypothetical protein
MSFSAPPKVHLWKVK